MQIKKVGVIGCGLMGHGIAQVAAQGGFDVVAVETDEAALAKGLERIDKSLAKLAEKASRRARAATFDAAPVRARIKGSLDKKSLADCDLVVEAIVENLDVKNQLFGELGKLCKKETIFASNTSSFPIAAMAKASGRPKHMVGLHFFNPVQLMKLVEVVRTKETSDEVFAAARAFGEACGKTPVACKDTPGFVVNRLLVPYMVQALAMLERGDASAGHRHRDEARLRLSDGPDRADRLRRARHDARDPRRLGRAVSEGTGLRHPFDLEEEGRREEARPQNGRRFLHMARRQTAVIFSHLVLALAGFAASASPGTPDVKWTAKMNTWLDGDPFPVHVDITVPKDGAAVPSTMLEPSGFMLNGKPIGESQGSAQTIHLAPGMKISVDLDLGPMIASSKGFEGKSFKLGYGKGIGDAQEIEVSYMPAAEKGLDFMKMPVADLSKYHVVMETNRGTMEIELWPDVAPNTVRNFLDLCYTGFYDGTTFHRVIPGFMIQGGDPTGTGTGGGPRKLKAEFNNRKHERGRALDGAHAGPELGVVPVLRDARALAAPRRAVLGVRQARERPRRRRQDRHHAQRLERQTARAADDRQGERRQSRGACQVIEVRLCSHASGRASGARRARGISNMSYENIQVDIGGRVATVTVNRPKVMNALNEQTLGELAHAFDALEADASVRALVVTGAGEKAFVAGADINELAKMEAMQAKDKAFFGQQVFARLERMSKPSVAMINGFALGGGCELALACTLRTASTNAMLGLPEVGLGIIPGYGGTQRLARIAGPGVAREWVLTGDMFSAEEAHRVGIVNRIFPPEELREGTLKLVGKILSRGPVAVRLALETIARGLNMSQQEGEIIETDMFGLASTTADMREGMARLRSAEVHTRAREAPPEFSGQVTGAPTTSTAATASWKDR